MTNSVSEIVEIRINVSQADYQKIESERQGDQSSSILKSVEHGNARYKVNDCSQLEVVKAGDMKMGAGGRAGVIISANEKEGQIRGKRKRICPDSTQ